MKIKAPDYLSTAAKRLWNEITADYEIDEAATMLLETTLASYDRREQARAAIAKGGAVIKDRFGIEKPSPWISIERDSGLALIRGFRALGLDLARGNELGAYSGGRK
jgi:phage terminase small subunit